MFIKCLSSTFHFNLALDSHFISLLFSATVSIIHSNSLTRGRVSGVKVAPENFPVWFPWHGFVVVQEKSKILCFLVAAGQLLFLVSAQLLNKTNNYADTANMGGF